MVLKRESLLLPLGSFIYNNIKYPTLSPNARSDILGLRSKACDSFSGIWVKDTKDNRIEDALRLHV